MQIPIARLAAVTVLPWLLLAHCAQSTTKTSYDVAGQVVDENGAPIAGAQLTVAASQAVANADAEGKFVLPFEGSSGSAVAVQVVADGFADRTLRVTVVSGAPPGLLVVMRPVGLVTKIVLPVAGEPDATVSLSRGDSTSTVAIPAAALVDGSGATATGEAVVTMTYWQAGEPMMSAPGPLAGVAEPDGVVQPLHSAGMLDLKISQAGAALQVAAGKGLPWQVTLGAASQAYYGANGAAAGKIALWSLDQDRGAFVQPVAAVHDPGAATLTQVLPHLSAWNYDYVCDGTNVTPTCSSTDAGGCVQGQAFDCNGDPLANQAVRVWAMGVGNFFSVGGTWRTIPGVKDFYTTTGSDGRYCLVTGADTADPSDIVVHVSGPSGPTMSNFPSPLIGRCAQCDLEPTACNSCQNGTPSGRLDPNARTYQVAAGNYCAGTSGRGCAALPDVYIGSACAGKGVCNTVLAEGNACDVTMVPRGCCAPGLQCGDGVCIPKV